jgi:hypothetical protein
LAAFLVAAFFGFILLAFWLADQATSSITRSQRSPRVRAPLFDMGGSLFRAGGARSTPTDDPDLAKHCRRIQDRAVRRSDGQACIDLDKAALGTHQQHLCEAAAWPVEVG